MPCAILGVFLCFGRTRHLHFHGERTWFGQHVLPKSVNIPSILILGRVNTIRLKPSDWTTELQTK